MRRASRFWGRSHDPICLRDEFALLTHRHAVVHLAGGVAAGVRPRNRRNCGTRRPCSCRSRRTDPTIGRIAVEVAPVAFAATWTAPSARRQQGKQATQRPAMPNTAAGASAAGIGARIATAAIRSCRMACRTAASQPSSQSATTARRGAENVAARTGRRAGPQTGPQPSSHASPHEQGPQPPREPHGLIAEDRLEQTAAGAGRHHAHKQTEKQDPFHDFLPLLLQSTADFRQTLSSEQSEKSRKSSKLREFDALATHFTQTSYCSANPELVLRSRTPRLNCRRRLAWRGRDQA